MLARRRTTIQDQGSPSNFFERIQSDSFGRKQSIFDADVNEKYKR